MASTVTGQGRTLGASFTRLANTTAYAAGSVMANATTSVLVFDSVGANPKGFVIIQQAICNDSANVATKPDLELFLFTAPPAIQADGVAFNPSNAEMLTCVGVIAFPTTTFKVGGSGAGAAGNSLCESDPISKPVNAVITPTNVNGALYGVAVVRNAYAPVSGEVFTYRLKLLD